jgi:hypothetical protein
MMDRQECLFRSLPPDCTDIDKTNLDANLEKMADDYIDVEVVEDEIQESRPRPEEGRKAFTSVTMNGTRVVMLDGKKGVGQWILSLLVVGIGVAVIVTCIVLWSAILAILGGLALLAIVFRPRVGLKR